MGQAQALVTQILLRIALCCSWRRTLDDHGAVTGENVRLPKAVWSKFVDVVFLLAAEDLIVTVKPPM